MPFGAILGGLGSLFAGSGGGAVAGGLLGGIGSIFSGLLGSGASKQASAQQYLAAMTALNQQQGMFNTAEQQQLGMFNTANNALSPYYNAGAGGIGGLQGALAALSGLTGNIQPALNTLSGLTGNYANMENSIFGPNGINPSAMPGFNFATNWGTKTTENALAAEGLGGSSGPLASGINQMATGLAGSYFPQFLNSTFGALGGGVTA